MQRTHDSVSTPSVPVQHDAPRGTDAHLLGPGWIAATVLMILVVSMHPIRRWRRARRDEAMRRRQEREQS